MRLFNEVFVRFCQNVKIIKCELIDIIKHFHSWGCFCILSCRVLIFRKMEVEIFSKDQQNKDEFSDNTFVDFIDHKRNKSTHDGVNSDSLNTIIKNLLYLYLLFQTLPYSFLNLFFEFKRIRGEYLLKWVIELLSRRIRSESIDDVNKSLVRSWNVFFVLVLRFFSGNHHWASISDGLHRGNIFRVGRFSLMLVFDMCV